MTVAAKTDGLQRVTRTFPGGSGDSSRRGPGQVRRFVAQCLGPLHLHLADAQLCACELSTNALKHTRSGSDVLWFCWFKVYLHWSPTYVRIAVEDTGALWKREPRVVRAPEDSEGLRGLALVAALSTRWTTEAGSGFYATGHTVTAEFGSRG